MVSNEVVRRQIAKTNTIVDLLLDKGDRVECMTTLTMVISKVLALWEEDMVEEVAAKLFAYALQGEPMYRELEQDHHDA